jgi:hypothetical protein
MRQLHATLAEAAADLLDKRSAADNMRIKASEQGVQQQAQLLLYASKTAPARDLRWPARA